MKKKVIAVLLMVITAVLLCACETPDGEYLEKVSSYGFWSNTVDNAIPQYRVYDHVNDFFEDTTVKNGDAVSDGGKIKKVLFLGFDGMRADALSMVVPDKKSPVDNYSGIEEIKNKGGLYLAYCGGEKGKKSKQQTSTSPGWLSEFTGVWGTEHGVKGNNDVKNMEYKTFMLEYAEKGLSTSLAFDWDVLFDVNLKKEVKHVYENPEIKMTFCDINRVKADKKGKADSKELYNFVAAGEGNNFGAYDIALRNKVLERISKGDDIVCGIFDNIDGNGHDKGFANDVKPYVQSAMLADLYAYQILEVIEEREENLGEEWLVIFASDHGGINKGHGMQSLEERTTWIATNVKFDENYYAKGYDGYKENK